MVITKILQLIKIGMEIMPFCDSVPDADAQLGSTFNTMLDKGMLAFDSMSQGDEYDSGCNY